MSLFEKFKKILKSADNSKKNETVDPITFQQLNDLRPDLPKNIIEEKQFPEIQVINPKKNSIINQVPEQSEIDQQREATKIKKAQQRLLKKIEKNEEEKIKRNEEAKRQEKEKLRREREEVKRREKEEDRKRTQLLKKIQDSGILLYITKYAEKHPDKEIGTREFEKLKQLLKNKGFFYDDHELQSVIFQISKETTDKEIKFKILLNNPENSEACIRNYLELFGNDIDTHKEILHKILKKIFKYKGNIESDIDRIAKGIESEKFESHLLSNSVTISVIDELSGSDFEILLKDLFKKMGYTVKHTPLSHDQGADLIVEKFGEITVIQAKNWENNVSNKAIQEVNSALKHYYAHKAIVISTSGFTKDAKDLAKSTDVILWDRQKLTQILEEHPVSIK